MVLTVLIVRESTRLRLFSKIVSVAFWTHFWPLMKPCNFTGFQTGLACKDRLCSMQLCFIVSVCWCVTLREWKMSGTLAALVWVYPSNTQCSWWTQTQESFEEHFYCSQTDCGCVCFLQLLSFLKGCLFCIRSKATIKFSICPLWIENHSVSY